MQNRVTALIALATLLIGILVGLIVSGAFSSDDSDAETAGAEGSPSSTTSTSASTTEVPTTTSTTPITSTTTSTTTTTLAPPPSPVANATNGNVVGLPIGSPMADVETELVARFGPPTNDFGWTTGCPLDGGEILDERFVMWGNFRVWFRDDEGTGVNQVLSGWIYQRGPLGDFDPEGPSPFEVVLHDGVEWNQTLTDASAVLGVPIDILDDFQLAWIWDGESRYMNMSTDPGQFFDSVSWRPADLCD